jgi:hypothetical protein
MRQNREPKWLSTWRPVDLTPAENSSIPISGPISVAIWPKRAAVGSGRFYLQFTAGFCGRPSTNAASPLWLITSLPPRLLILPPPEPSTMTWASGSIVKLPRRFPRTYKKLFISTIVSLTIELHPSNELLTRSSSSPASCAESIAACDPSAAPPLTSLAANDYRLPAVCRKIHAVKI